MHPTLLNKTLTHAFSSREELIDYAIAEKKILVAINAEKILNKNSELQKIINNNIGYADGIGAVLALKRKGVKNVIKIPGCELWLDIIQRFETSKSFYLVGSTKEIIENSVSKLKTEFPNINICNYRDGFLSEKDIEILKQDLIATKPDVVFIAMGTPKQEFLMNELTKVHPALYQGLGGSFDVYTGNVKRAPKFFIKLGIEWLYRLLLQPTRIKRQIVLVNFFFRLLIGRI